MLVLLLPRLLGLFRQTMLLDVDYASPLAPEDEPSRAGHLQARASAIAKQLDLHCGEEAVIKQVVAGYHRNKRWLRRATYTPIIADSAVWDLASWGSGCGVVDYCLGAGGQLYQYSLLEGAYVAKELGDMSDEALVTLERQLNELAGRLLVSL